MIKVYNDLTFSNAYGNNTYEINGLKNELQTTYNDNTIGSNKFKKNLLITSIGLFWCIIFFTAVINKSPSPKLWSVVAIVAIICCMVTLIARLVGASSGNYTFKIYKVKPLEISLLTIMIFPLTLFINILITAYNIVYFFPKLNEIDEIHCKNIKITNENLLDYKKQIIYYPKTNRFNFEEDLIFA